MDSRTDIIEGDKPLSYLFHNSNKPDCDSFSTPLRKNKRHTYPIIRFSSVTDWYYGYLYAVWSECMSVYSYLCICLWCINMENKGIKVDKCWWFCLVSLQRIWWHFNDTPWNQWNQRLFWCLNLAINEIDKLIWFSIFVILFHYLVIIYLYHIF